MGRFTVIPEDTFDNLQLDAGILLSNFNPATGEFEDSDIICATTGGINATCVPTYSDFGEDVDNCPANMKELKHLDSWECKLGFTALDVSPEVIKLALGAADVSGDSVTPRRDLSQSDFSTIWWVGDKADGGMVAISLLNALSTGGFSLQTTKNGKGQVSCELTGHVSINAQSVVPMIFWSTEGNAPLSPDIVLNRSNLTLTVGDTYTLVAGTTPSGQTVSWASSATGYATVAEGVVEAKAEGTATITASMTYDGETYTDTCTVTVEASA